MANPKSTPVIHLDISPTRVVLDFIDHFAIRHAIRIIALLAAVIVVLTLVIRLL